MQKPNQITTLIIILAVIVLIGVGILYLPKTTKAPATTQPAQQSAKNTAAKVFSIAGKVIAIDGSKNILTVQLQNNQNNASYTVHITKNTKLYKLALPAPTQKKNKQSASVAAIKTAISLKDITKNNIVYVQSSNPIIQGKDIANPTEIQVLP